MIKHYALKVDTQNLGASFIYFENDKLTLNQAQNRLKEYQIKFDNLKNNGITPTVPDTERDNKSYKITNMYVVPINHPFIKLPTDNGFLAYELNPATLNKGNK